MRFSNDENMNVVLVWFVIFIKQQPFSQQYLVRDLGGSKTSKSDTSIDFEFVYTREFLLNQNLFNYQLSLLFGLLKKSSMFKKLLKHLLILPMLLGQITHKLVKNFTHI